MEDPATLDADEWVERARTVKTANHDFFSSDPVLIARLQRGIGAITQREHRTVKHWAKHHLPGYTE